MNNQVMKVEFAGAALTCTQDGQDVWVSLKRACENIGIGYGSQTQKLNGKAWAVVTTIVTTGLDGKNYNMLMIHLDSLPMWLATIDANRVAPEVKPRLEQYQKECAQVLRDHFFNKAPGPDYSNDPIMLLRAAQLDQERQLAKVQADIKKLQDDKVPAKTLRAEINRLVRDAAEAGGRYGMHWNNLYYEYLDIYGDNLRVRAKNRDMETLDYAQAHGKLQSLHDLAVKLFT